MFHAEVLIILPANLDRGPVEEWRKLRPSGSNEPYRFPNKEVAEQTAKHCYPEHKDRIRVVPA